MKYLSIKLQTIAFAKPLLFCGFSEIIFQLDHLTGNIAFIVSTIYAIYKLSKEDKK